MINYFSQPQKTPRVEHPIVVIVEPDSLGNAVTNVNQNGCTPTTINAYKEGITFAVDTITAAAPNVALYIDAGHGGWLGFENNAKLFAQIVAGMGILPKIRGFSTNVANFQPLGGFMGRNNRNS